MKWTHMVLWVVGGAEFTSEPEGVREYSALRSEDERFSTCSLLWLKSEGESSRDPMLPVEGNQIRKARNHG